MKKIKIGAVIFLLVCILSVNIYAIVSASITMSPATQTVERGKTATISIDLSNVNAPRQGILGVRFYAQYDKNIFDDLTNGSISSSIFDNKEFNQSNKELGDYINLRITDVEKAIKADASGLATISFKVKDTAALGETTISFTEAFSYDTTEMGNATIAPVKVTIKEEGGSGGGTENVIENNVVGNNVVDNNIVDNNVVDNNGTDNNVVTNNVTDNNTLQYKNQTKGNLTSNKVLPNTGITRTIVISGVVVIIIAGILYFKYKKI